MTQQLIPADQQGMVLHPSAGLYIVVTLPPMKTDLKAAVLSAQVINFITEHKANNVLCH
jgi:hypothetical protein